MKNFNNYLSLIKFSHTIFALPFALIGFFLAIRISGNIMDWRIFVLVLLCMVFARSAAMAFNRYIDRNIDAGNERTAQREIPAGVIKPAYALGFVIINCALFITSTYFINSMVFYLSPIALLVVLGYSYTKRFTWLCHFVLGVGLSLAPIGAYLSVTGKFAVLPIIYSFVVLLWVSGFDIIYALQDQDFDKSKKLKSIPVLLGTNGALNLSIFLHVIAGALVIVAGFVSSNPIGFLYWIGATFFIGLLIYQHLLVKPNDLSKLNLAFFTTNGIASVIFGIFAIASMLLS